MATGQIHLSIVNGQRQPFDTSRLLVTAIDGRQKDVRRVFLDAGKSLTLDKLAVHENPDDRYTVLVASKGHSDAGFNPVTIKPNVTETVELMMLRRDAAFDFATFEQVSQRTDVHRLLSGESPANAQELYERMAKDERRQPALACLLNLAAALDQMQLAPAADLDQNPLRAFKGLDSSRPPEQDRMFAWVDARLRKQVEATVTAKGANGLSRVVTAPASLHPGATCSFKQVDFGEGNVQLSFHDEQASDKKTIGGVDCVIAEVDIDYFQDTAAHILLEVFPNKLKSLIFKNDKAKSLTDPRTVYGLRWIAGRRLGREFAPLFRLN